MRRVELGDLDHAADRHRADLPVHRVAGTLPDRAFDGRLPAFEAGHELRIAVRVADHPPHGVAVGVDDAMPLDAHQCRRFFARALISAVASSRERSSVPSLLRASAHQPITGNRRSAASRSTPACRLSTTFLCTTSSSASTSIGSSASTTILAGSGMWPARSPMLMPHGSASEIGTLLSRASLSTLNSLASH